MVRYLSVCSGIEAATVAWEPLGWTPVAFAEINPFASAVLTHHYPSVPNWGDITRYATWPETTIDVLVGGTPCQSFSLAGLRHGLNDARGNLMLTFLEIAARYRPRWVIWENVPGVLSSNGGRDFGTLLGGLEELGYGWAYRTLDAQHCGVPQRRRRVFVVGCRGDDTRAAQALFEPESVGRHDATITPEIATAVAESLGGGVAAGAIWWDGRPVSQTLDAVLYKRQVMPEKNRFPAWCVPPWTRCACCEDYWCHVHDEHVWECSCPALEIWAEADLSPYDPCIFRFVTPRECERLQGFPDDFTDILYRGKQAADGLRYKALGNSMAVPVMRWLGARLNTVVQA